LPGKIIYAYRLNAANTENLLQFLPLSPGSVTPGESAPPKAPLCKGGWLPVRADWGIVQQSLRSYIPFGEMETSQRDNPSVKNQRFLPPPFTQGRLFRAVNNRPYRHQHTFRSYRRAGACELCGRSPVSWPSKWQNKNAAETSAAYLYCQGNQMARSTLLERRHLVHA